MFQSYKDEHFALRQTVEIMSGDGKSSVRVVARCENISVAWAAFEAAKKHYSRDVLSLVDGARIIATRFPD